MNSLSKAAVLADEFVLTHRIALPAVRRENKLTASPEKKNSIVTSKFLFWPWLTVSYIALLFVSFSHL